MEKIKGLKGNQKPLKGKLFLFPVRGFHGQLKHMKSEKSTNFWATEKYNIPWERFWKDLFEGKVLENFRWNCYHQEAETNLEAWYVNEKFLLVMTYYISLKRSWKVLFKGNVFEDVD